MTFDSIAWLIPSAVAGIGLIVAMIKWPKVWLGIVFLILPFFLSDSGKGISASEAILASFVLISVTMWISLRILSKEPLLRWWGDFLVVAFIVFSIANVVVALLNQVELLDWISEWSLFLLMLYYFPIREYFGKSEEDLKQLLVLAAVSSVLMVAYSIWEYKMRASDGGLVYAYQILSARSRLFGPVFVMSILVGVAMVFHARSFKAKLALVAFILVNVGGLLQSFTRSLWLVTAGSVLLMMIYFRPRQNLALVAFTLSMIAITYVSASLYSPRLTKIVVSLIERRINTSTQLSGGDYSFESRIIEAEQAIRWFKENPMGGNGLRAKFVSWGPIELYHGNDSFVHIGFISLFYKLGIPLSLLYLTFLCVFSWRAVANLFRLRDRDGAPPRLRALALAMAAFVPVLFANLFVAGFIDQRYGNVMLAVFFAFVSITYELSTKDTIKSRLSQ